MLDTLFCEHHIFDAWSRHSHPAWKRVCTSALQGSPEELRHAAEVNAADAIPDGKIQPGVSYAEKAKAV